MLQAAEKSGSGLTYIPPAKPKLPGHEESYNPPKEYLPTGACLWSDPPVVINKIRAIRNITKDGHTSYSSLTTHPRSISLLAGVLGRVTDRRVRKAKGRKAS